MAVQSALGINDVLNIEKSLILWYLSQNLRRQICHLMGFLIVKRCGTYSLTNEYNIMGITHKEDMATQECDQSGL